MDLDYRKVWDGYVKGKFSSFGDIFCDFLHDF